MNETGTEGEGLSPGRCLMAQQHEPGLHQATARRIRRKWSLNDNRIVVKCYYRSDPGRIGYRKGMHCIFARKDMQGRIQGVALVARKTVGFSDQSSYS